MVFVTVGASPIPFDRLLAAVDALALRDALVVQHGPSPVRPRGAECTEFMSFDSLTRHVAAADVVVAHAGVGSIMAALAAGKRPVVMARLAAHGEAVDDHQLPFAQRLAARGLLTLVADAPALGEAIAEARAGRETTLAGDGTLARDIRAFIEPCVAPRPTRRVA